MRGMMVIAAAALLAALPLRGLRADQAGVLLQSEPLYQFVSSEAKLETLKPGCLLAPCGTFMQPATGVLYTTPIVREFKPRKNGRYKVAYSYDGKKWKSGFIKSIENVDQFLFEPDIGQYTQEDDLIRGHLLYLDERAFEDFTPPKIQNSFVVERPFDEVWMRLVGALAAEQFPIETLAKDSGLITTKMIQDPLGDTMVCATAFDQRGRLFFNIFVQPDSGNTAVIINSTFNADRDGRTIPCYSNGTIEEWLISKVR